MTDNNIYLSEERNKYGIHGELIIVLNDNDVILVQQVFLYRFPTKTHKQMLINHNPEFLFATEFVNYFKIRISDTK